MTKFVHATRQHFKETSSNFAYMFFLSYLPVDAHINFAV